MSIYNNTRGNSPLHEVERRPLLSHTTTRAGTPSVLEPKVDVKKDNVKGLIYVTISTTIFAVVGLLVKILEGQGLSPAMILEIRSLWQVLISTCLLAWSYRQMTPEEWRIIMWQPVYSNKTYLFLRALAYWGFIILYWNALALLMNGDATAITYLTPMIVPVLSYFALGERVSWLYPVYLVVNMAGLALIVRPSFLFHGGKHTLDKLGVTYALLGCLCCALMPILTRLSRTAHWIWVEVVSSIFAGIVFTPVMFFIEVFGAHEKHVFSEVTAYQALAMMGIAALGYTALAFNILGYQYAEAARASLLTYTEIPLGYLLQWLVFGEVSALGLVGSAIIVCAAFLRVYQEFKLQQRETLERDSYLELQGKSDTWDPAGSTASTVDHTPGKGYGATDDSPAFRRPWGNAQKWLMEDQGPSGYLNLDEHLLNPKI